METVEYAWPTLESDLDNAQLIEPEASRDLGIYRKLAIAATILLAGVTADYVRNRAKAPSTEAVPAAVYPVIETPVVEEPAPVDPAPVIGPEPTPKPTKIRGYRVLDTNGDGRADLVATPRYTKIDTDFDGSFDKFSVKPIRPKRRIVQYIDTNGDGNWDRKRIVKRIGNRQLTN